MKNLPKNTPLIMPNQMLQASRFEIWSEGKKVEEGKELAQLWVEQEDLNSINRKIKMTVKVPFNSNSVIYDYIDFRFYFDVAYAINDRIIVGIIPQNSNIKKSDSYSGFISFAPFFTREWYSFEEKIPFCCSLFYDDNETLIKVSYSNGMNNTQIIFYT